MLKLSPWLETASWFFSSCLSLKNSRWSRLEVWSCTWLMNHTPNFLKQVIYRIKPISKRLIMQLPAILGYFKTFSQERNFLHTKLLYMASRTHFTKTTNWIHDFQKYLLKSCRHEKNELLVLQWSWNNLFKYSHWKKIFLFALFNHFM